MCRVLIVTPEYEVSTDNSDVCRTIAWHQEGGCIGVTISIVSLFNTCTNLKLPGICATAILSS